MFRKIEKELEGARKRLTKRLRDHEYSEHYQCDVCAVWVPVGMKCPFKMVHARILEGFTR